MKKLCLYFSCVLLSANLTAQKNSKTVSQQPLAPTGFCTAFSKVRADIIHDFKKLRSKNQKQFTSRFGEIGYGFNGSVKIPGAGNNIIETNTGSPDVYKVYFGTSATMEEGQKKLENIKQQLSACLPGFTITDRRHYLDFPLYYEFVENRTDGLPPQKMALYINKHLPFSLTSSYSVFVTVDGASPNGTYDEEK